MASFVAGPNKFALLANAFTGAAKGANDFAELKQRSDTLKEQKRQHDDNLKFGFEKLDEQIRQFDVGTSEKSRLEGLALEARHKLGIGQSELSKSATLGAASIRAREQREDREANNALRERNVNLDQHVNIMESHNVAGLWADWKAHEAKFNAGETTEQFDWNTRADTAALAIATKLSLGGPPTPAQIALAREQVDNYQTIKATTNQNRIDVESSKALARMGGGAGGFTGTGAAIDFEAAYTGEILVQTPSIMDSTQSSPKTMRVVRPGGLDNIISQIQADGENPLTAGRVESLSDLKRLMGRMTLAQRDNDPVATANLEAQYAAAFKQSAWPGMTPAFIADLRGLASAQLAITTGRASIEGGEWAKHASSEAYHASLVPAGSAQVPPPGQGGGSAAESNRADVQAEVRARGAVKSRAKMRAAQLKGGRTQMLSEDQLQIDNYGRIMNNPQGGEVPSNVAYYNPDGSPVFKGAGTVAGETIATWWDSWALLPQPAGE